MDSAEALRSVTTVLPGDREGPLLNVRLAYRSSGASPSVPAPSPLEQCSTRSAWSSDVSERSPSCSGVNAFTDSSTRSGICPPAASGACLSPAGHVSSSFTAPKKSQTVRGDCPYRRLSEGKAQWAVISADRSVVLHKHRSACAGVQSIPPLTCMKQAGSRLRGVHSAAHSVQVQDLTSGVTAGQGHHVPPQVSKRSACVPDVSPVADLRPTWRRLSGKGAMADDESTGRRRRRPGAGDCHDGGMRLALR